MTNTTNGYEIEKLLKVSDVARLLHLSQPQVYRLIYMKEIPYHKFESSFRFKKSDVDAYIRQNYIPCY